MAITSTTPPQAGAAPIDGDATHLRQRFRYLVALIRFLRHVNENAGDASKAEASLGQRIPPLSPRARFTEALTTILVMDHEIIAAIPLRGRGYIVKADGVERKPQPEDAEGIEEGTKPEEDFGYEMSNASNFATIANPRHDSPSEDGIVYLLEDNRDYWTEVKQGNLERLIEDEKSLTLAVHAKTIDAYLHDHYAAVRDGDKALQQSLGLYFQAYLLLSCWRKMYRRLATWSALGLMYLLGSITPGKLNVAKETVVKALNDPEAGIDPFFTLDQNLCNIINDMQIDDMTRIGGDIPEPDLHRLKAQALSSGMKNVYVYETVQDFHYFFVRLLITFTHDLKLLGDHLKDPNKGPAFIQQFLLKKLAPLSQVLAGVTHSPTLARHFNMIGLTWDMLPLPNVNNKHEYMKFAAKLEIIPEVKSKVAKPGVANTLGTPGVTKSKDSKPEAAEALGTQGAAGDQKQTYVGDKEQEGEALIRNEDKEREKILVGDQAQDAERGELHVEFSHNPVADVIMDAEKRIQMFISWIKIFISHFPARRAMERHACLMLARNHDIRTYVLGMKRSSPEPGTWTEVEGLIRELAEEIDKQAGYPPNLGNSTTADKKLKIIIDLIGTYAKGSKEERASYNKVYEQFSQLLSKDEGKKSSVGHGSRNLFCGDLHCEAILAAIARYFHELELPDTVKNELLKAIFADMDVENVAVSRLCCPVCWDLFDILRGQNDGLNIRGRHPVLYDVELPSWLPFKIVQMMVERYEGYAIDELKVLKDGKQKRTHTPLPSGSQKSDGSFGSSSYTVDTGFFKGYLDPSSSGQS